MLSWEWRAAVEAVEQAGRKWEGKSDRSVGARKLRFRSRRESRGRRLWAFSAVAFQSLRRWKEEDALEGERRRRRMGEVAVEEGVGLIRRRRR